MLSRRITRSHKLAGLKSDTARLFFCCLIPYLDVDGRMEADVRLIKADIFPLLEHVTPRVINRLLAELHAAGLIVLYECNGLKYIQVLQFETHQRNLRKDREAKSTIPPPTPDQLRSDSGPTPEELRNDSRIREEKLREEKLIKGRAREDLPVDNSKPVQPEKPKPAPSKPEEKKPDPDSGLQKIGSGNGNGSPKGFLKDLQDIMPQIFAAYPDFAVHRQVQFYLESHAQIAQIAKGETNPLAVLHALRSFLRAAEKGVPPPKGKERAWLESAFRAENAKYNARDFERSAAQWKGPMKAEEAALYNELIAQAGEVKGVA